METTSAAVSKRTCLRLRRSAACRCPGMISTPSLLGRSPTHWTLLGRLCERENVSSLHLFVFISLAFPPSAQFPQHRSIIHNYLFRTHSFLVFVQTHGHSLPPSLLLWIHICTCLFALTSAFLSQSLLMIPCFIFFSARIHSRTHHSLCRTSRFSNYLQHDTYHHFVVPTHAHCYPSISPLHLYLALIIYLKFIPLKFKVFTLLIRSRRARPSGCEL